MKVLEAKRDNMVLEIHQDDNPDSPRNWDNIGRMICFHRNYGLGDKHDYQDAEHAIREIVKEIAMEKLSAKADEIFSVRFVDNMAGFAIYKGDEIEQEGFDTESEAEDELEYIKDQWIDEPDVDVCIEILHEVAVVLSLYLIDHSGISMNTRGFGFCDPQGWDWGQVGFIYATKKRFIEETGYTEDELFSKDNQRTPKVGEHVKLRGHEDKGWGKVEAFYYHQPADIRVNFDYNKTEESRNPDNVVDATLEDIAEVMANRAEEMLNDEVEIYDQYLRGDVYGFVLKKVTTCEYCGSEQEEHVSSCWGFYGSNWKENGMLYYIPEEYADMIDELEEAKLF